MKRDLRAQSRKKAEGTTEEADAGMAEEMTEEAAEGTTEEAAEEMIEEADVVTTVRRQDQKQSIQENASASLNLMLRLRRKRLLLRQRPTPLHPKSKTWRDSRKSDISF